MEESIHELTTSRLTEHVMSQREEFTTMKRLVQLYVDDTLPDEMSFGLVRQKAFDILPKEAILSKVSDLDKKESQENDFYWQATDLYKRKTTSHLRHLVTALHFSSTHAENRWMEALKWMKKNFKRSKNLAALMEESPEKTIPVKLIPYFLNKQPRRKQRGIFKIILTACSHITFHTYSPVSVHNLLSTSHPHACLLY